MIGPLEKGISKIALETKIVNAAREIATVLPASKSARVTLGFWETDQIQDPDTMNICFTVPLSCLNHYQEGQDKHLLSQIPSCTMDSAVVIHQEGINAAISTKDFKNNVERELQQLEMQATIEYVNQRLFTCRNLTPLFDLRTKQQQFQPQKKTRI